MRMSKIITAALAISLISATASVAQPAGRGYDRTDRIERQVDRQVNRQVNRQYNRQVTRQHNRQATRQNYRAERRMDRRNYRTDRRYDRRQYRADMRDFRRGRNVYRYDYNEFRRFDRGHRFQFNPRRHVVINDWNHYHLSRPPHGYHWVRNGNSGDYILAAITTGIIMNMMFGHYY